MIRTDSAGGTHAFLDWLSKAGRWLSYSVGMTTTDVLHQAMLKSPKKAWTPAYDAGGTERSGAWVAEITDMPDLSTWPKGMRLIVRKERPHPGAQLRFTDLDGLRLTCFATNTKGGQLADLELRHRRRARCEDRTRNARDTDLRVFLLHDTAQNRIWLEIVSLALGLLAWMPMLALTGDTRRWEPKKLRLRLFSARIAREHRTPPMTPLHGPMARDRRHHPRDRHAPHSLEPRLTSNVDRLDAPHRRSGARRPPDTRAGPSACINLEETAPRKHRAPVSTPTRTHEPSLACQDGAAEVEYPRMHVTQSDESERNLSQEVRIEHAWSRIVDWLRENFPNHHQAFNSGARTSLINAAEEEIGVAFPVELRTWMSMNNGSTAKDVLEGGFYQPHPDSVFLPGDSVFLDLRQIVDVYRDFLADGTEWRPGWIPFARQSDASYGYFLDVGTGSSPAPVMIFMEESPPKLAFPSLADFLEATANALEGGEGIRALGNRISYRPATDTGMVRWKRSENAF